MFGLSIFARNVNKILHIYTHALVQAQAQALVDTIDIFCCCFSKLFSIQFGKLHQSIVIFSTLCVRVCCSFFLSGVWLRVLGTKYNQRKKIGFSMLDVRGAQSFCVYGIFG